MLPVRKGVLEFLIRISREGSKSGIVLDFTGNSHQNPRVREQDNDSNIV